MKRIKDAKKTITRNAVIISILVFIFITALTFIMSVKQVSATFQNKFNQTMLTLESWHDVSTAKFDDIATTAGHMMRVDEKHAYPIIAGFYSLDGELKYTSGSIIDIEMDERIHSINIDKYLTENVIKEAQKFFNHSNRNELRLSDFKYCIGEEGIVPVELTFEIVKEGEPELTESNYNEFFYDMTYDVVWSKTVKLSDEEATDTAKVYGFYFIDKTFSGKDGKLIKSLYSFLEENTDPGVLIIDGLRHSYSIEGEEIFSPNSRNLLLCRMGLNTKDRGYIITEAVNLRGERGYFIFASGQDIYREAVTNPSFISMEIVSLIAVALAALIIRRSLIKTALRNLEIDESKHAFMSATAHELKTPIAIIQNQAEMIMENVSPEKNQIYIESIYEEAKRMDNIVRTMQQYDKISKSDALSKAKFDLSEVARNELSKYKNAIQDKEIQIIVDLPDSYLVNGDENLLALVIDNYLSNAWKYTAPGGTIKVKMSEAPSANATFSVFNTSAPLSEKDLKNIWSAMYKGDSSRTRVAEQGKESGGMGLTLCKRILDLHGFSYGCRNADDGVEFYFRMNNHV